MFLFNCFIDANNNIVPSSCLSSWKHTSYSQRIDYLFSLWFRDFVETNTLNASLHQHGEYFSYFRQNRGGLRDFLKKSFLQYGGDPGLILFPVFVKSRLRHFKIFLHSILCNWIIKLKLEEIKIELYQFEIRQTGDVHD